MGGEELGRTAPRRAQRRKGQRSVSPGCPAPNTSDGSPLSPTGLPWPCLEPVFAYGSLTPRSDASCLLFPTCREVEQGLEEKPAAHSLTPSLPSRLLKVWGVLSTHQSVHLDFAHFSLMHFSSLRSTLPPFPSKSFYSRAATYQSMAWIKVAYIVTCLVQQERI